MVNRITKRRLKLFFKYDLWKVLVVSALVCVILLLTFNFVAKKPSDGQTFKILIDDDVMMSSDIDLLFEDLFTKKPTEGGFSYEMLKGDTTYIYGSDENPEEYLLRSVYGDLNYDDIVIFGEDLYLDYLGFGMAADINEYVASAKDFLISKGLCNELGEFDERKVNEYFDSTRKRDTRFKTKEKKEQGRRDELERLKGIWFMATALEDCFNEHPELLDIERKATIFGSEVDGVYALKLSSLVGKSGKDVTNLFSRTETDEEGNVSIVADDIYVAIGNNKNENGDLYYEMLAVLYTLIENYTTYL